MNVGLKRIVLRDFVIVSELELELERGFSVLTGETGAGKSILIDALQLATGARADSGVVREGAQRAEVCAEFEATAQVQTWLDAQGFGCDEATLLLRRTVDTSGKSRAWVNGSPATATQLREVGEQLLDIHGQHAWQSLTKPESLRGLLDAYARIDTQAMTHSWHAWRQAQQHLEQAQAAQTNLQRDHERLTWQISELEKLNPLAGEWDELNTQHTRLANVQSLLDAAQSALQNLQDDDSSALRQTHHALQILQQQSHVEPEFEAISQVISSGLAQLEDGVHSLRAYLRHTDTDPSRLAELDARMTLWMSLARRYKRQPHELADLLANWRQELAQLHAASDLASLQTAVDQAHKTYLTQAKVVSQARAKAAPRLARAITAAMQGLGMQGGRFEVSLTPLPQAQLSGLEDIAFLVAGHPGSTPRAVGKVASGGELSRIALAIAVTTSQLGTAQTLIFDEVDAGVGGAVAQTVGRLMKQLGQDRQVLAVTHLPQVAACADHHLVVAKKREAGSTLSSVCAVAAQARISEIARMLGGEQLSDTTLAHAREMLQTSSA